VTDSERKRRFELLALPQLDAAYNLARWLVSNDRDAEDVVQDAYLRAYRYFDTYRGGDARSWMLSIVRRSAYDWLARNRSANTVGLDVLEAEAVAAEEGMIAAPDDPETAAIRQADRRRLSVLIAALPEDFRAVVVLRDVESLSYREIAQICDIPLGTVMSRLARGRALLRRAWEAPLAKPMGSELPGRREKTHGV